MRERRGRLSAEAIFVIGLVVGLAVAGSVAFLWWRLPHGGCGLSAVSFGPWARDKRQVLGFQPDPNQSTAANISKSRFGLSVELVGTINPKVFDFDHRPGSALELRTSFPEDLIDFGNSPANRNFTVKVKLTIDSADPWVTGYRFFGLDNEAEVTFSFNQCYLTSYAGSEFSEEQSSGSPRYGPYTEFALGSGLTFTLYTSTWIAD